MGSDDAVFFGPLPEYTPGDYLDTYVLEIRHGKGQVAIASIQDPDDTKPWAWAQAPTPNQAVARLIAALEFGYPDDLEDTNA